MADPEPEVVRAALSSMVRVLEKQHAQIMELTEQVATLTKLLSWITTIAADYSPELQAAMSASGKESD